MYFHEFKSKKTLNINSSHQMKLFDTNIDQLDGTNRCQLYFYFFSIEIWRPLSLLSQLETEK
jgi:hypothetical protein